MVHVADIVRIPFSEDMTIAGVAHLLQALQLRGDHPAYESFDAMRQYVAEKAALLAFRRSMDAEGVPYSISPSPRYQNDLETTLRLGGRSTKLFTTLVHDRRAIALLGREPERIHDVPALVPRQDEILSQGDEDIYVFTAITGLVTRSRDDLQRAADAGQALRLIYPMPRAWRQPDVWRSLGDLVLKTDISQPITVTISGVDADRSPVQCELVAQPGERMRVPQRFHAIRHIVIAHAPDGPLGVHSPRLNATEVANMYLWGNLMVYGMDVYLLGYLTYSEYQRRANLVPTGSSLFGIPRTAHPLWSVPVPALRPMRDLFERVKRWAGS